MKEMQRFHQDEELFETKEEVDKKDDGVKVLNVEIELKSISSIVKQYPDISMEMWRYKRNNMDEGFLRGDEMDDFLHGVLKKWHEFRYPREKSTLRKAQTKQAVGDLKKVIFSAQTAEIQDQTELREEYWMRFIDQMKRVEISDEAVSPVTAFETFAGKMFDPADANAVDPKIVRSSETPSQRYHRLTSEIKEFKNTLADFLEQKESAEVDRTTVQSLSKDLSTMSKELEELSKHLLENSKKPNDSRQLSELGDDLALNDSWEATEPAVFTLLKSTGGESFELKNLQERLTNLESVIGQPGNDFKMSSLEKLSNLDVLVNPSKMDAIENRINALTQQLDRPKRVNVMLKIVMAKRSPEPDELLNRMSRYDKIMGKLPKIIERLQKQQAINSQTAGFVGQVNTLDAQQKVLSSSLEESKFLLTSVLKNISLNMQQIKANVSSLEGRISRLAHS